MLALLSIALTGMAQTTAVINFSSTEGGTVSASTLDYQEVKSGDVLAVGTEISLRVNLTTMRRTTSKDGVSTETRSFHT